MKKGILVFLALLLTMLTGCKKTTYDTSPEYNPETDYNMGFHNFEATSSMIETEKGVYYIRNSFLRFIDKRTMEDIAVCNRPDCTHGEGVDLVEDLEKCSAFLGLYAPDELFYYQGEIYGFVSEDDPQTPGIENLILAKISEDGTKRQSVWNVKWKSKNNKEHMYSGVLHRGVYYFYTNLVHTSEERCFSIYAYDFETKKTKHLFSQQGEDGFSLIAIGNYLYWFHVAPEDENGMIIGPDRICRLEISTGSVEEFDNMSEVTTGGDYVYFSDWNDETWMREMYRTKRDGTGWEKLDFEMDGIGYADDQYIYARGLSSKDDTSVHVYDAETFEEVATLEITEKMKELYVDRLFPGNDEVLFMTNYTKDAFFYSYKSAIGTPDFQWFEVEKVN